MSFETDIFTENDNRASLDLIYGHLTTTNYNYRKLKNYAFSELNNWYVPANEWHATGYEMVATIQGFRTGGYEVNLKNVDMVKFGSLMANKGAKKGKREKPEIQNHDDVVRSVQRAKKNVRYQIKQKKCDRLLTLTMRESDASSFKNENEWLVLFQRFVRLCKAAGVGFEYVSTLEKHKKGNFHLHAAIDRHIHINTVRKIWWLVVGKGQGNVDISFKQHQTTTQRLAGVAKYVSKYITKQLDNFEFNKKRYWASKSEPLEKPKKIILKAQDIVEALKELAGVLQLDFEILRKKVFQYGNAKDKVWFDYDESMQLEIPF